MQAACEAFLSTASDVTPQHAKHVQVLQNEMCVVYGRTERAEIVVSSDEATTCCIAVIRCPVTGVVSAIHVDGGSMRDIAPLRLILQQMREVTPPTLPFFFLKIKLNIFLDALILKIFFF